MSPTPIAVLLVEDNPDDVALFREMLAGLQSDPFRPAAFALTVAGSLREAREWLGRGPCDLILFDLNLPDSRGMATIEAMAAHAAAIPAIILTGLDDDGLAREALKLGGQDYLVKGELTPMFLKRAVDYAIERFKILKQREDLVARLRKALDEIKTLRGIVPICANCKRIRDDQGYWEQLEAYLHAHSQVQFSHGICPECSRLLYGIDTVAADQERKSNPDSAVENHE